MRDKNEELADKIQAAIPKDWPFVLLCPNLETGKGINICTNQPSNVVQSILIKATTKFSPNMKPTISRKYEDE